jgi:tRNA threonylcarbamoyladenosine biosynthesis protein TsaB
MGSLAITRGESLLAELSIDPVGTQGEIMLSSLERLLADLSLTLDEMDAFAVVHGPGAFTGLRVGVATIKGFALATGKPVVGVSSLQTLALQVPDRSSQVYALLDARKNEVYAGCYQWRAGKASLVGSERVIDPELLLDDIDGEAVFVGDGSVAYRTLIVRKLGDRARVAPSSSNVLRAGSAVMLGLENFRASETVTPEKLNPVYIRPSDAEINMPQTVADCSIEG